MVGAGGETVVSDWQLPGRTHPVLLLATRSLRAGIPLLAEGIWARCLVVPQGPSRAAVGNGTSRHACCKLVVTRVLLQRSRRSGWEPAPGLPRAACHSGLLSLTAGWLLALHGAKERQLGPVLDPPLRGAPWLVPLLWGKAEGRLRSALLSKPPGPRVHGRVLHRSVRRVVRLVPGGQGRQSEPWLWRRCLCLCRRWGQACRLGGRVLHRSVRRVVWLVPGGQGRQSEPWLWRRCL